MNSLRNLKCKTFTTLTTFVNNLRDKNLMYEISCSIIVSVIPFVNGLDRCKLCNRESYLILKLSNANMLDKSSVAVLSCTHKFYSTCLRAQRIRPAC